MSTTIRPEISQDNQYWISKHRYYELKHFCLQYPEWKQGLLALSVFRSGDAYSAGTSQESDPTAASASRRMELTRKIDILDKTAFDADPIIGKYILRGVITGRSYDTMKARLEIPCCKDTYYHLYRRFFWLLDQRRD